MVCLWLLQRLTACRGIWVSITCEHAPQSQQQVVEVDMDLTWRAVYSIARSNYSPPAAAASLAADAADDAADGPCLLLCPSQLRKSMVKVHIRLCLPLQFLYFFIPV